MDVITYPCPIASKYLSMSKGFLNLVAHALTWFTQNMSLPAWHSVETQKMVVPQWNIL